MNTLWQNLNISEKIAAVQAVAADKNIEERAVEKDWWVTAVMKAIFNTECAEYLLFKGGTSLSKGWNLISRFSEDLDLSINRTFYIDKLGLNCAKAENNTQLKNLRKASRDYIHETLSQELAKELERLGIAGFQIQNLTEKETLDGIEKISHDSDPTVIFVNYDSIFPMYDGDIEPRVKIEISCLSMAEPFEVKAISSLLHDKFADIDGSICSEIKTVTPSRTFLEKIFLLNEEFQKDKPRSRRMSRHLYDIDKIMDSGHGDIALSDLSLYRRIVEHRRKFYHLGYVNYDLDYPEHLSFIPQGEMLQAYQRDYEDNMIDGYIYGKADSFEDLLNRLQKLQDRLHQIKI